MSKLSDRLKQKAGERGDRLADASKELVSSGSRFWHTFEASVDKIQPDPQQPRKRFVEADLHELAQSMTVRQLQPIGLKPAKQPGFQWTIVWGERRWRAAQMIGWDTILAVQVDEEDTDVLTVLENLQRVDLSPLEEANGFQRILDKRGISKGDLASLVGKSNAAVSQILKLLQLNPVIQEELLAGDVDIPRSQLYYVASAPSDVQLRIWPEVKAGMNREALRQAVAEDAAAPISRQKASRQTSNVITRASGLEKELVKWKEQAVPIATEEKDRLRRLRDLLTELIGSD